LDPPTFSQSREHGVFRAETDFAELVAMGARVLGRSGVMFASTNVARLEPERFLGQIAAGLGTAGRNAAVQLFVPQPPDFPTCREEPGYLKTVWIKVRPTQKRDLRRPAGDAPIGVGHEKMIAIARMAIYIRRA
jgi:23S rRNA G2069 N7-methylase RlmK/C1962 C5-methylase RlmI